jgi:hypothetical protein
MLIIVLLGVFASLRFRFSTAALGAFAFPLLRFSNGCGDGLTTPVMSAGRRGDELPR